MFQTKFRKILATVIICILSFPTVKADRYLKIDFTSGNLWLDMISILGTYAINKPHENFIADNYLTITSLAVDVPSSNYGDRYIMNNSNNLNTSYTYKFPDLLNGLGTGIKYGYFKQQLHFISAWSIYGSLHLTYNYFKLDMSENRQLFESYGNSIIRCSPGIGANVILSKPPAKVRVTLDVNLRYDLPIFYSGKFGDNASCLNSGFSPRVSFIIGGPFFSELGINIGIFYEYMNYNWFKPSEYFIEPYNIRTHTIGANLTIYPWKKRKL